ncbi:MAG TPA: amino acid adenylation domain-containing protein, partial [Pseudomonadales bacterium]|nr:amino acid adenylation domain-containing protein [Pseudomonadales bacterium]
MLTKRDSATALPSSAVSILSVDQWIGGEEFNAMSDENLDPAFLGLSSINLAYVLFTSGSTGFPKGVMNQHNGVVNRLLWAKKEYRVAEAERVLQKTPFGFDVSVWEFFLPLLSGATLVVAPPESHQDPHWLLRIIDENRISMLHFVPSMLSAFLSQFNTTQTASTLKKVLCSGEALPYSLQQRFFQFFPQVELHTLYGPTEAAIDVTYWRCDQQSALPFVPIGYPVDNVKMYILDRRLQPVPIGAVGEIYIGGIQVARGYLNQPDLTAERFIKNPFETSALAKLYKTGDLGRWLADGAIEYLGRNDFQVKIRGIRVELGEIETVIAQCEGVREAVVIAREDGGNDKRLVAYVVPNTGVLLDVSNIRNQIARQLSEYMVPSAIILLDALPVTANGKLDRKALPAPDRSALAVNYYEPPQGEVEHFISTVWQETLNVEKVGRHDNFFRLGGHSLTALQLLARLRERGGFELTLRDVFSAPTLAELARQATRKSKTELSRIAKLDRNAPMVLSWAQQRLWFLHQLDPSASAAYQMSVALKMVGKLNVEVLIKTLNKVVQRHESLRTCFYENHGVPFQRVLPENTSFPLVYQDLRRLNNREQDAHIARYVENVVNQSFDLEHGPLIRGALLKLSDQKHVLVLTQHHIISDGWSIGILVNEVSQLYAAEIEHKQADLLPLPIHYADYAAWQRKFLTKEKLQEQISYWREQLTNAPELIALPVDRARPAIQSYAGGRSTIEVPQALYFQLKALSQKHDVTLFMTLLCAWFVLLARLSNQRDVVIGVPVAGRQSTETEHLIGFFVNTLALRVTYEPDLTVAQALGQIRNIALNGFANQDIPFEQVVDALSIKRSLNHSPLFQVMLAFNNATLVHDLKLPDLSLSTLSLPYTTTHYDLTLLADETADGLLVALEYSEDLFEKSTVDRFGEQLLNILNGLLEDSMLLGHLPLLSKPELNRITNEFNSAKIAYDKGMLLHKQFELHAQHNPNQVALVFNETRISYAQLNQRANRIAHALLRLGVQADDRVALFLPRDVSAVAAVLGVLKSGAAYVPIDVSYPFDRIKFIIDDATPKVVLTQTDYHQDSLFNQPVVLLDEEIIYVE